MRNVPLHREETAVFVHACSNIDGILMDMMYCQLDIGHGIAKSCCFQVQETHASIHRQRAKSETRKENMGLQFFYNCYC